MIRKIVSNINELRKPCEDIHDKKEIDSIVQDLKDTLADKGHGVGLSANQIGIQKKVSYIKIPVDISKNEYKEIILINPKIKEKTHPIKFREGCLSFPGIFVETQRYTFILLENDGKVEMYTDIVAIAIQHEYSHLYGKTIFDFRWKSR